MTTVSGVLAVARQELRLRVRTGRWRWLLGIWCGLLGLVTIGVYTGARKIDRGLGFGGQTVRHPPGVPMFGALMLVVLAVALLVVPALTAQSINGDRDRGVLATLQVTLLSPLEIALGKLVAAWGVAVVFLALTLPWVGWSYLEGGVSLDRVVVVLAVIAALLGVFCATSLGLSSLLARTTTSAVLSYLTVFGAVVGTVLAFGLAVAFNTEHRQQSERVPTACCDSNGQPTAWATRSYSEDIPRPDRVWWLLAPNPFVVLADAAPVSDRVLTGYVDDGSGHLTPQYSTPPLDVLSALGNAVREVRKDPVREVLSRGTPTPAGPLWPTGLAVDVVLGAAMVWVTARRLRTPATRLPRGQRVA